LSCKNSHLFLLLLSLPRRIVLSRFGFQSEESPGRIGHCAVESTDSRKVMDRVTEKNRSRLWSGVRVKRGGKSPPRKAAMLYGVRTRGLQDHVYRR